MSTQTEHDPDFCVEWQPILHTVFTSGDIAQIITAIESHKAASSPVTTTQPV